MAFKIVDGKPVNTMYCLASNGGTVKGAMTMMSSGKVIPATAYISASTAMGIARETVASGSYVLVDLIEDHIIEADFTGSSKTSVTDADVASVFDLTGDSTINLDDTTNGSFVIGANAGSGYFYDNTNLKVRGKFLQSIRYI